MDDMEGQVRELLRRQADDVPPQLAVPPTLAGRAHRRFAMNALGAAVVVIVLAAGAFAAFRPGDQALVNQPGASETGATTAIGPCTAAQQRTTASLEGAMGSREGELVWVNVSDMTCTLEGTPDMVLYDAAGAPIEGITFTDSPPGWLANRDPKPEGWPVVTLAPGDRASVRIRWSNWCADPPATWSIPMGEQGGIATIQGLTSDTPPCNGPGLPSTIEVGPFEPSTS
jgi:hypothetical protein